MNIRLAGAYRLVSRSARINVKLVRYEPSLAVIRSENSFSHVIFPFSFTSANTFIALFPQHVAARCPLPLPPRVIDLRS